MQCELCGGLVTWRGPLINLTHTECGDCGGQNCQVAEYLADDEELPDADAAAMVAGIVASATGGDA